jgi:hypothetical protein
MRFALLGPWLVMFAVACSAGSDDRDGGLAEPSAGGGETAEVWRPVLGTSWQWQLSGLPIDTSYDVEAYDVDLFDSRPSLIDALHDDGRIVICYFSAGSWESFRPDADQFPDVTKGSPLEPPFEDELWLDIRDPMVRALMIARLDRAESLGCDAVEPDNVDGYANDNGHGLSAEDQLDFNRFIAAEAHARGLSIGLKNDLDQLDALADHFDWALNEECFSFEECDGYADNFVAQNKAVFHVEYVDLGRIDEVCAVTGPLGFSTLIKDIELDADRVPCP